METDLSLILNIQANSDEKSLKELIDRHSGIYVAMVNKTIPDSCPFLNKQDLLGDKNYYIYNAALKFLPEKNTKFSTYLANETKWRCLNLYNKNKKSPEEPLDDTATLEVSSDDFLCDLQKSEILNIIFDLAKKHPDKRVERIIEMRYNDTGLKIKSWNEISKALNMSIQGCINIHDKFLKQIRKEICITQ